MKKKRAKIKKLSKEELAKRKQFDRALVKVERMSYNLTEAMKAAMTGDQPKNFQFESLADCAEIRRWLNAIYCGDFKEAAEIQWDMDTATRDDLPSSLYNFVENQANEGEQ